MKRPEALTWAGVLAVALGTPFVFRDRRVLAAADLCSIVTPNPYLRSEHETHFIGSARSDTVRVRISDVPSLLRPSEHYPYRDSTPVFGQVVRVQSVDGADADRIRARLAAGDSTVVVIRYANNSMCQTFPVRALLDTGFVNHYTVFLRPDSEWAEGRPTFDIGMLARPAVYPGYLRYMRGVNLDTTLTVDVYASLVKALPLESEWFRDCREELRRIEAWARTHKPSSDTYPVSDTYSDTYPVNDVLRVMRWHCGVIRKKQ